MTMNASAPDPRRILRELPGREAALAGSGRGTLLEDHIRLRRTQA